MHRRRATITAALALTAALGLGSCSSGSTDAPAETPSASNAPSGSAGPGTTGPSGPTDSSSTATDAAAARFGPACSQIPASGPGSVEDMADSPVGTAAKDNPLLSTLAGAAERAGLLDTLDSAQDVTVFAPANAAFQNVDASRLARLMADPQSLGDVLRYHVVQQRLTPEQVTGTHTTLSGRQLTVAGSGENMTVGANKAKVLCGNVQTANATIYVIDGVLLP